MCDQLSCKNTWLLFLPKIKSSTVFCSYLTSVSSSINKLTGAYGGSEKSSASFLRKQHVKYNSLSKAKDFGRVVNLQTTITGDIGGEAGSHTLFFKVTTDGESDIKISKNSIEKYKDQYISIGLLNGDGTPMPTTLNGFAYKNEILNTDILEGQLQLPQGDFYLTVTNSQWQTLPFSVNLQIIRYVLIDGTADGQLLTSLRIGLIKLFGQTSGTCENTLSLLPKEKIKSLEGTAFNTSENSGYLTINSRGTIELRMSPSGRLKMYWRVNGTASGTSSNTATLTVTTPGGGYGP